MKFTKGEIMKIEDWGELEIVLEPEIKNLNDVSQLEKIAALSTKTTIQRKPAEKVSDRLKEILVINTARGGHLTVFMNKLIVFSLYGLSRQATTTLHYLLEHYNTSQSSDRYNYLGEKSDEGRKPRISLPKSLMKFKDEIKPYVLKRWGDYQKLMNILENYIFEKIKNSKNPKYDGMDDETLRKHAKKISTQYARVVFPAASTSSLIFSLNIVELARLWIITKRINFGEEFTLLVEKMYNSVKPYIPNMKEIIENEKKNISSFKIIEDSLNEMDIENYKKEFSELSKKVLIDGPSNDEELVKKLNMAYFVETGKHLEIEKLKDEIKKFYSTSFGLQNVSPVLRCLENVHFTFAEEMTQYEFEQSVRHRKVRHFTNFVAPALSKEPDFIMPKLVSEIPEAREIVENAMKEAWMLKNSLVKKISVMDILSLIPRGIKYRVVKTSDLKNYLHETILRACLNAQQEINYHKYIEIQKLNERYPSLKGILSPRCVFRYELGINPYCPEMDPENPNQKKRLGRWCGYPMWNKDWSQKVKEIEEREF